MPFTFSHPAIVLPFLKTKIKFSTTGLILGSIIPDYEYILQLGEVQNIGHHFIGIFVLDLPLAFLFSYLFHFYLRNITIQNLPIFFKNNYSHLCNFNWHNYVKKNKVVVVASILLGVLSHLFLDGFTHKDGFFVEQFNYANYTISLFNKSLPIYFILQIFFSVAGLLLVLVFIMRKLGKVNVAIKEKDNYKYWQTILIIASLFFIVRVLLMPKNNGFWSLVLAVLGVIQYAWLFVSLFYKYKLNRKFYFICLLLLYIANNGIAQTDTPLNREALIQKATEYRKQQNYTAAIKQLDSLLIINKIDAGILLFKGDLQLEAKQYKNAVFTFKNLLPLQYESTITKINLSYALFMSHKNNEALHYAQEAYKNDTAKVNAIVNYFNALLWNTKTTKAEKFLKEKSKSLSSGELLILKARLATTKGDFKKGLALYDSLITQNKNKYYIQEYAEVLLGKKRWKLSNRIIQNNKALFSKNELTAFNEKLNSYQQQQIGSEFVYFKDIGKNIRTENSLWWQQKEAKKYRIMLKMGIANFTSAQQDKATALNAAVHIDEQLSNTITGQTDVVAHQIDTKNGNQYAAITGKQLIKYQPNDRRMLSMFYSTDILNYTASLIGNNIRSHNVGYTTHILIGGKTGIYSEGSTGFLTDKNKRQQIFVSLYRLLRTEPTLKTGINFSKLHFSDNSITKYFSPNSFINTEAFIDYTTPITAKLFFQSQAAAGVQQIEKQKKQSSLRFQTELRYQLKKITLKLKYQTSNTASANGTGYSFNWFTGRIMYNW